MIFSGKRRGRSSTTGRERSGPASAEPEPAAAGTEGDRSRAGEGADQASRGTATPRTRAARRSGPYDAAEAPPGGTFVDLGSLRIPAVDGVDLRVQADPEGRIQQVLLVGENSALQLGAFAAPRTEPVWDEAREQLREQLHRDGFTSREADGEFGAELLARVRTPEGMTDLRFVGIDGPRWLLRAVFQGSAATDPQAAPELLTCLRGVVVQRGGEAMPVHEALPLRLPREVAERAAAERAAAGPENPAGAVAKAAAADREVGRDQRNRVPRNR